MESAAYYVVAEALSNAARYAQATHCVVKVARDNGHALVEVKDDGIGGADPQAATACVPSRTDLARWTAASSS